MMIKLSIVVCSMLYAVSIINGQNMSKIEGIRLANRTTNGNGGRVEVLYRGTWGTICDGGWDSRDAEVACRMLGFDGAVCGTRLSLFRSSTYYGYQPIHMSNVLCIGDESTLDLCSFIDWEEISSSYCNVYRHHHDAGVICRNDSQESFVDNVGVPYDISLVKSSTTSLTIQWSEPESVTNSTGYTYTISFEMSNATSKTVHITYTPTVDMDEETIIYTIANLARDTEYNVRVRINVDYPGSSFCTDTSYRKYYGHYSDVVTYKTNAIAKQSNITVRLISPSTITPYLGRVEVLYSNQWGTVCDNGFGMNEANVICWMLNYTNGAFCTVPRARLGRGYGTIWLDNLDCDETAEILEDCTYWGWGRTYWWCDHYEDVGVVCNPGFTTLLPVQNLHVSSTRPNSITIGWSLYRTYPPEAYRKQLRIHYKSESQFGTIIIYTGSSTMYYTIQSLSFNVTYNISIQAVIQLSSYCASASYVYGEYSKVTARTMEAAPSSSPRSFQVTVLNDTSIKAEWQLPPVSLLNGIIRGFKVFIRPASGGDERTIDIRNRATNMYTITELQPATAYFISALIYTIADGPRTSPLIAITHSLSNDSMIEGIRLVDQNGYGGRVEVLYQQIWGTICDRNWDDSDAEVACRMLGFEGAICSTVNSHFRMGVYTYRYQHVHMSDLECVGNESALDECAFSGWEQAPSCDTYRHRDDAGVLCRDVIEENAIAARIGVPYNLTLNRASIRSLTIRWTKPVSGTDLTGHSYTISYKLTNATSYRNLTYSPNVNYLPGQTINYTIGSLSRNTEYNVRVRMNVNSPGSSACSLSYLGYYIIGGNYSNEVTFRTNAIARQSFIPVRLISPISGANYLGKVEVQHNNLWGGICDDLFSLNEANVICKMLNFNGSALCVVQNGQLGYSYYGTIWLDNLQCDASAEVLEDCTHRGWGIEYCSYYDAVGVVCNPGSSTLPAVRNVTIISQGSNNVSIGWNRYTAFPYGVYRKQIRVYYESENDPRTYITIYSGSSQYTILPLRFNTTYNISIQPVTQPTRYCSSYIYGTYSTVLTATTMESAPSSPPTLFQITVINSTSIEAEWALPPASSHNGIIRGFKLFWRPASPGGIETTINIADNITGVYALTGLQPATAYTISVLAYTVADGPRTVHLTAITYKFDPLISTFGIDGNGLIKATRYTYSYRYGRVNIHCGVDDPTNVTVGWYFTNGSIIPSVDRNFQSVYYANGTAILKIANYRTLSYCDGGVYVCIVDATDTIGSIEESNFTLVIDSSPPTPDIPFSVSTKTNSITIGWRRPICDGGHMWMSLTIRYRSRYYSYQYIRNVYANVKNYTISGLTPNTWYSFSFQATTVDGRDTSYSSTVSIRTLPPAPSAPREVQAILLTPQIVEVTWRVPATPNGVISRYTVYAIPLVLAGGSTEIRARRQAEDQTNSTTGSAPQRIIKVFPGTATSGNITIDVHSITYQFQVRASLLVDGVLNDGELSPITKNSTVFVPEPGRPMPVNVRVNRTANVSITLIWDYPPPPAETVQLFLITYSGDIQWRSVIGNLYLLEDSGEVSTRSNSIKISPLVPGTMYQFRVSAISANGRGAEVVQFGETLSAKEIFAHLQLRFGPIESCFQFKNEDGNTTVQLLKVRRSVALELTYLCPHCGFTINNIKGDEFSCLPGLTKQVIYRARIIGTEVYSAPDFVSLMGSVVGTGRGSIIVDFTRLYLDPTCPTPIFSLKAPICGVDVNVTTEASTDEASTDEVTTQLVATGKDTSKGTNQPTIEEIGIIVIGVIIIILLATLIIMIVVLVLRRMIQKRRKIRMQRLNFSKDLREDSCEEQPL